MSQQGVIGLIGGMSWESSAEYYRIINQAVRPRLGGLRSARCLMWSFDFGEIEALQHADAGMMRRLMIDAAQRLERVGADFFLICTNPCSETSSFPPFRRCGGATSYFKSSARPYRAQAPHWKPLSAAAYITPAG